jgi:transcriptional regulator with XRE-family HTH domain
MPGIRRVYNAVIFWKKCMQWTEEICKIRDASGLSDSKMALDLGVSKQYLSAVLTGSKEPSRDFKLKVWERMNSDLDTQALLSFLKPEQAQELLSVDAEISKKLSSKSKHAPQYWTEVIEGICFDMNWKSVDLALYLDVSQPFASNIATGKRLLPWPSKMNLWRLGGYQLERDSMLNLFVSDIAPKLLDIEQKRVLSARRSKPTTAGQISAQKTKSATR